MIKQTLSALVLATTLMAAPIASAQTASPTPLGSSHPRLTNVCDNVTGRIDNHLQRYQDNHAQRVMHYQDVANRVKNVMTTLQNRGVDVTTLGQDLATFNQMMGTLNTDHDALVGYLNTASSFDCGNAQGDFKGELQKAKSQLQVEKTDVSNLKTQGQKIISDINALKAQYPKNSASPAPTATP